MTEDWDYIDLWLARRTAKPSPPPSPVCKHNCGCLRHPRNRPLEPQDETDDIPLTGGEWVFNHQTRVMEWREYQ